YRFEESDQRIQDASSHGRAGALTGSTGRGVDSASAALGRGLRISGGHLMLPALGDQEALSIELWLKLNGMPAADLATLFAVPGWEPGFFHCNLRGNGAVELAIFGASSYTHTEPQRIEAG